LYLNPPDKAVVLCVDEKSRGPGLGSDRADAADAAGIPEKQIHDYVRHGTTTLFAALEIATGRVQQACLPRHRHQEFLRFLKQVAKAYPRRKLHLVVDNYDSGTASPLERSTRSGTPLLTAVPLLVVFLVDHPSTYPGEGLR
jgi:hypothetical protein